MSAAIGDRETLQSEYRRHDGTAGYREVEPLGIQPLYACPGPDGVRRVSARRVATPVGTGGRPPKRTLMPGLRSAHACGGLTVWR